MSGFEIVGVVLGAAPLFIKVLGKYKTFARMTDAIRRKKFYIERLVNALSWQKTLIEGDVEILLRSAGVDEHAIQSIGSDAYGKLFEDANVQQLVQEYLGSRQKSYLQVISECERSLLTIARSVKGLECRSWASLHLLAGCE